MFTPSREAGQSVPESAAYTTRPLGASDLGEAGELLDSTLGRGFWSLDVEQLGSHRIALLDGAIVGVASASILDVQPDAPELESPVALIRLVAVAPTDRGQGVASRLTREVCV